MTEILPLLKPLSPYIPQALAVIIIGALIFVKTFSREKEILSRMDKLSDTIQNIYKKIEAENKHISRRIEDINEKYHSLKAELYKDYVSKKDMKEEMERIVKAIDRLREDIKTTSLERFNDILRRLDYERKG